METLDELDFFFSLSLSFLLSPSLSLCLSITTKHILSHSWTQTQTLSVSMIHHKSLNVRMFSSKRLQSNEIFVNKFEFRDEKVVVSDPTLSHSNEIRKRKYKRNHEFDFGLNLSIDDLPH